MKHGEDSLPGPDTLRYLPQIAYVVTGLYGGPSAAAMFAAASADDDFALAPWGGGWAGSGLSPLSRWRCSRRSWPHLFPALYIWMLATSVTMWRAGSAPKGRRT
jgi:hypothetical protein